MTLNELIAALSEHADAHGDAEVLLGHQPSWPLAETVAAVITDEPDDDPTAPEEPPVVWIVAGGHPDFRSPYAPRSLWTDAF